jgi:putative phosphoribosyl transferase
VGAKSEEEEAQMAKLKNLDVIIPVQAANLKGTIHLPTGRKGIVIFVHGNVNGRSNPRNQSVARALEDAGIGTLLIDLITDVEASERKEVFNIPLLADRLLATSRWLRHQAETKELALGYFGGSTGAGAALQAAAMSPDHVMAVVSRGGRPDLALNDLPQVKAPSLFIVGGRDTILIHLNQKAFALLRCVKELKIVPDASHLFEEPGALDQVVRMARDWFLQYFSPNSPKGQRK